ncbi:MAG: hypothetical protein ABJJ44_16840 [Paraglaciecola sp.]|uniref:hypothetical protein n=1 Tax=Paraglaciecola sp. TaxID=1920173 RepID=UPI003299EF62
MITTINNKFVLCGITSALLLLSSCNPAEPSDDYPDGILFQNIEISIDDSAIQVLTDLSSDGEIYLSNNNEHQFLTINNNEQYPLQFIINKNDGDQQDNITFIETEALTTEIQTDDEFTLVFSRANGSTLKSVAFVPVDITYITPLANDIYDHNSEDLVISWESQPIDDTLFLTGDCVGRASFALTPAQTSLTIPANSLLSIDGDNSQCEVTISLYPISYGSIDENLAGGSFRLQKLSALSITLTNLRETYDE